MYLQTLYLRQFRNYQEQLVTFSAPKTILVGANAQGKSNLLEAVAFLALLKSYRSTRDRELVCEGAKTGKIRAQVQRDASQVDLAVTLRANSRRTVAVNSTNLRRQWEFLGYLKVVQFSSLDLDLVRGSPAQRRHWLDNLLVQLEPFYAHIRDRYERILRQRNSLLKEARKQLTSGEIHPQGERNENIALWNAQLAAAGTQVMRRRARALSRLTPIASKWHHAISGGQENLEIHYTPNVKSDNAAVESPEEIQKQFLYQLEEKAIAEKFQGTTLVGPHRDEVTFAIDRMPVRQFGSQGQQRTLVLSLKLAELQLIEEVVGEPPLLLLDDVLAELDPNRQHQLLEAIQERFQTLVTATHLEAFDAHWLQTSQILKVDAGEISIPQSC
ncbi:DNA replication/repair protein RecF [Geitlerinema sp. PCC 9228]|jgi:DNA replication and repair protein RecF|uniref:DNA replication/repair protein RecF n=1 Tax=Geitlerinema sp. PCC 9228 TaxID=111611 RepID=UPI0008F999D6|nr:DNA replication/repair protein RecF [Geitlerinema sp. PCC 9228]